MPVEVRNLSFSYGTHRVLNDLSFSVPDSALVAVLGPNGVGKSTLFRCLLGLLRGYEGEILLNGRPRGECAPRDLARIAAYVPQSSAPTFSYTVFETVLMGTTARLGLLEYPGRAERERAENALRQLGIEDLADRRIDQISGGEQQLVLLARALAQDARLLVMDEPTANLDYGNQQRVLQSIVKLTEQGYTVLLSTHHPDHALRYATHVLALQDGRLAAYGETEAVLTSELVEKLYCFRVQFAEMQTENGTVKCCIPLE